MSEGKEAEGILYRHFTIMNRELEHLQALIRELDSKAMRLQQALESLESKTSSEDSRLQHEIEKSTTDMTSLNSDLRRDHEALLKEVAELDGRLAEKAAELVQLKVGFEKELAPFVGKPSEGAAEVKPSDADGKEQAKEQFIADMQSAEDPKVEEIAESIETEEERKKRKRK